MNHVHSFPSSDVSLRLYDFVWFIGFGYRLI